MDPRDTARQITALGPDAVARALDKLNRMADWLVERGHDLHALRALELRAILSARN